MDFLSLQPATVYKNLCVLCTYGTISKRENCFSCLKTVTLRT